MELWLSQDIEIVLDGGAYCTLSPVPGPRGDRCRRRILLSNVRIPARAVATIRRRMGVSRLRRSQSLVTPPS